ncbi:hypothetical protein FRX31_007207 [Thalictrum thalictroides]|uniref:CCHC-type domain-containing protein n=1 Tax=Thalictrum thalictroides TaxID=46969 RepID=A0A7J6X2A1_THATH|nr:hypothetical protein FRX31_007207 [Thalictrum thalictroides]
MKKLLNCFKCGRLGHKLHSCPHFPSLSASESQSSDMQQSDRGLDPNSVPRATHNNYGPWMIATGKNNHSSRLSLKPNHSSSKRGKDYQGKHANDRRNFTTGQCNNREYDDPSGRMWQ